MQHDVLLQALSRPLPARPLFASFPWQNGSVLNVGSLRSRVERWIEGDPSRVKDISRFLLLVSLFQVHFDA